MRKVYLDNAACTPVDGRVRDAMLPYLFEHFGNPSSIHEYGAKPREAVEEARKQVAALIGADSSEIVFTSNGSEANNMAIKGVSLAGMAKGRHLILSGIEHFSVMHSGKSLEKLGFKVSYLPADNNGIIKFEELKSLITNETLLVSLMHANHEIGTIQPVKETAALLREINKSRIAVKLPAILLHTDAVQTAGNIPVNVKELGVDLLTLAGSQFYGPKGAAALYIRKGVRVFPLIDGGIQEEGRRAGLENVPAIVGLGKAAELAGLELTANMQKMLPLRDKLIKGILEKIKNSRLNGEAGRRLPSNVNVSIEFIEGESMLMFLDGEGIAASSGSACTSRALKASHVLLGIGVPIEVCHGSILFSLNKYITEEDIDYVLQVFPGIVEKLRKMSPLYKG